MGVFESPVLIGKPAQHSFLDSIAVMGRIMIKSSVQIERNTFARPEEAFEMTRRQLFLFVDSKLEHLTDNSSSSAPRWTMASQPIESAAMAYAAAALA